MKPNALVFVNGECDTLTLERCRHLDNQHIVCVDGGLRHCVAAGLKPDVLIGDLDSATPSQIDRVRADDIQVIKHPIEKDATDLELALEYLSNCGIATATLVGMTGGRVDQTLANLLLLGTKDWPFDLRFLEQSGDGVMVSANKPYHASLTIGQVVSLMPLAGSARGVSTKGLKYPLSDAALKTGQTLGVSNECVDPEVSVTVKVGRLLLIALHV